MIDGRAREELLFRGNLLARTEGWYKVSLEFTERPILQEVR